MTTALETRPQTVQVPGGYTFPGFPYVVFEETDLLRELKWIEGGNSNFWVLHGGRVVARDSLLKLTDEKGEI